MKCPKCGADNPDNARFCSLCMETIDRADAFAPAGMPAREPGEAYAAPGEWRGDRDTLAPQVSEVVTSKIRRFRVKVVLYAIVIAAVVVWLVLSFTVWGNPSAGKRSGQLMDAVNDRNMDAFLELFEEHDRTAAEDKYRSVVSYLGDGGRYEEVSLVVDHQSNDEAVAYIDYCVIRTGGGSSREISRSANHRIILENQKGRWYVVPRGTDIVP